MRTPVNALPPGMRQRISSVAVAFTVDAYEQQPTAASVPIGRLGTVTGSLVDDASQSVARQLRLDLPTNPDWLAAGMWLVPTVGIQTLQPIIYRMPSVCITDITEDLSKLGGASVTAEDPSTILNGQPYEADTTLTGTLRTLVSSACSVLTRPADVSGVPALNVPINTVAEFGTGRWDVCLSTADSLGVQLRFTDLGDVVGIVRGDPVPAPAAVIDRALSEAGNVHHVRAATNATVLVTRGPDTIGLLGHASWMDIMGRNPPSWYLPVIATDRQQGDSNTTQATADQLARDLLRARLADTDTYVDMPILPAPWLEAGADVVSFQSRSYYVRAVSFDFPSLATRVTLRRVMGSS